jgi:hypothetical protein
MRFSPWALSPCLEVQAIPSLRAGCQVCAIGTALRLMHGMIALGGVTVGAGTFLFQNGHIHAESWIVAVGVGVYLALTPFSGAFFDRLIAATRTRGTAVFLVFLADGVGYLGTLALLLYKTAAGGGCRTRGCSRRGRTCLRLRWWRAALCRRCTSVGRRRGRGGSCRGVGMSSSRGQRGGEGQGQGQWQE